MSAEVLKVLIIDDCPEDREMYIRYLGQQSEKEFKIIESESGEEGLELCKREHPDCALIDYQIPDLDGLEFIQALAKDEEQRYLPVLMLTGQGNEGVASEALKGGASDYLVKSKLTPEGLYRAVTRAIEKANLLQTNDKQQREIERSYRELEQFAHTASHDLQAPVRRITKFLELIQMDLQESLSERSKDYLERALKGAAHMRRLIQDLLDYSLVGGAKNSMEPVCLNHVLKEVLTQLEVMVLSAKATVKVDEMPTIMGNQTFLQQLFQNLIGNAIKFCGEQAPVIKISAHRVGAKWTVTVKDNGIGIPDDALESVFGIFQRVDSGSQVEGTGIGLALCKKIVELHDGCIWVESTLDEGTTFNFTLPACFGPVDVEMLEAAGATS